jgi:hypothetical protein
MRLDISVTYCSVSQTLGVAVTTHACCNTLTKCPPFGIEVHATHPRQALTSFSAFWLQYRIQCSAVRFTVVRLGPSTLLPSNSLVHWHCGMLLTGLIAALHFTLQPSALLRLMDRNQISPFPCNAFRLLVAVVTSPLRERPVLLQLWS